MRNYVVKRLLQLIPILLAITFLSFAMMRIAGSDAVEQKMENTGSSVSQEVVDAARAELGLDKPFLTQYCVWLGNLLRGDMGTSYISGKEVFSTFISKLPATLLLTVTSILLTIVISIPLGILAAVKQNRFTDYLIRVASFLGNSMIFQDAGASLCPIRTIGEQIYESMSAHRPVSKEEARDKAYSLFEKLHFKDSKRIWDSYPFELSGGMNQRAGIAIAMLMDPAVLLADELTSALDVAVQKQVVLEMKQLRDMFGTAIILVTHDIGVVSAMADTVLVLKDGNRMEYGPARQVLNHPENDYTKKLLAAVPKLRRA